MGAALHVTGEPARPATLHVAAECFLRLRSGGPGPAVQPLAFHRFQGTISRSGSPAPHRNARLGLVRSAGGQR